MGLNIKNEETVRLVRELADELGVSMTSAITEAVTARLAVARSARPDHDADAEWDRAMALIGELRERLGTEYLAQDFDAILYDERGLPR